jgi:hypothetical protein
VATEIRPPDPTGIARPSHDMSISGRLMPYLWLIVGATLTLTGASNADGGRWFLLGPGVVCLAVTAGIWRVDWGRVPV